MNAKISESILRLVATGKTLPEAIDAVLGAANIELQSTMLVRGRPSWDTDVYPPNGDHGGFAVVRPKYTPEDKYKSFAIYFHTPEQAADLANAILQAGQMLADQSLAHDDDDSTVPLGADGEYDEAPITTELVMLPDGELMLANTHN